MAAVREGRRHFLADVVDIERGGGAVGQAAVAQPLRQVHDADAAIGSGDGEAAAAEIDIGFGRFQHIGSGGLALFDHQFRGLHDGLAARGDRAGATGAVTGMHDIAVALLQFDGIERHTEAVAQHLRERRGVALAVIERSGHKLHRIVVDELDLAELDAGRGGDFQIRAHRDATQLAALAAFALASGEAGMIGEFQRVVEHTLEVAAVIGQAVGGGVGDLRRLDEIAPPQRQPVDLHLVGRAIDQALEEIIRLGTAGAAVGAHQRGVGDHALDVDLDQRGAVDAGDVLGDVERQRDRRDA